MNPIPTDPSIRQAAFEVDLDILRTHPLLADVQVDLSEWETAHVVYIIMPCRNADRTHHVDGVVCLRADLTYYPTLPALLEYVNPRTHRYDLIQDRHHLPRLAANLPNNSYKIHEAYRSPTGLVQLLCHSWNGHYYFGRSTHSPGPNEVWRAGTHTFAATVLMHDRAHTIPYYGGRHE